MTVLAPALEAYWLRPRPAPYLRVWEAMQAYTADRGPATPDQIWLTEHPPVFTLGQAGREAHVLDPAGIPVVKSDRGGQVTYHGPGQLLAYVLFDLRRAGLYVKDYIFRLESALLATLAELGLHHATRYPGAPGIYLPRPGSSGRGRAPSSIVAFQKIAAIGVRIRNGCAYHGVSLNVAMDLQPFSAIDPCGYPGLTATDLRHRGLHPDFEDVGRCLARQLAGQLAIEPIVPPLVDPQLGPLSLPEPPALPLPSTS